MELELSVIDDGGQHHPLRELTSPEAVRLSDLLSLRSDLEFAARCCDLLATEAPVGDVAKALHDAAVVAYGRCFMQGRSSFGPRQHRLRIGEDDLLVLTDAERSVHVEALNERNWHVAHRVRDQGEVIRVHAFGGPGDEVFGVTAVAVTKTTGTSTDQLAEVARKLSAQLGIRISAARESLSAAVDRGDL